MQQTVDGKGTSKPTTAEEQNEIRRAKKAKQKRSGGSNTQVDGFLTALQEERRQQREAERHARELEVFEFQHNQALQAKTYGKYVALKSGTTARVVAQAMLEAFPSAQADKAAGISKTEAARRDALQSLTTEQLEQTGAVKYGTSVAAAALRWAYAELKK